MGALLVEEDAEMSSTHEAFIVTRHSLEEAKVRSRERLWRAHVLVAEDNQVNQKVAVRMLERLGYRADVAANGVEALEALSRIPYAAVLMDVQMPEMGGYEATSEIRRREEEAGSNGRRTPIIAMTADAMQGDREKAIEAGMDDYVPKPVKSEELEAVLERWIPQEEEGASRAIAEVADGPVTPEDAEDPFDRAVIDNLLELGGSEMLSELVKMFFDDAKTALSALREALSASDPPSMKHIAHTLKDSSVNMGAKRMSAVCSELEDIGASGDLTRAPALLGQLEEEFSCVRPALEAEAEKAGSGG
jgi:CheY-like chemotaxis protein/HPt (histidine-containing phosphotransfer) domain-containing protein